MEDFVFQGLGTRWSIASDGEILKEDATEAILIYVKDFEARFSRFLPESENNAFRNAHAGEYRISKEFALLLNVADRLRLLTNGRYDPAVGMLLEQAGYGAKNTKTPPEHVNDFILPVWSIAGDTLTLDGPAVFDFGGFGKGYCIDQISRILSDFGYEHFLVDGGGDMYGTVKKDLSPWKIAIEYPGKPEMALGTVLLENQGIAVSDSFRRRWGKWHLTVLFHAMCQEKGITDSETAKDALIAKEVEYFPAEYTYTQEHSYQDPADGEVLHIHKGDTYRCWR